MNVFRRENFGRFLKTEIQVYTRNIWVFFLQKAMFQNQLRTIKGIVQLAGREFMAELSKLHSNFTWVYTDWNQLFLIIGFSDSFFIPEQNKISLFSESSRQASQNCILRVQRNRLRRKMFFPQKSSFLNVLRP